MNEVVVNLESALASQDRAREEALELARLAHELATGRADKEQRRAEAAEQRAAEWEEQARIEYGHWAGESTARVAAEQRAADAEAALAAVMEAARGDWYVCDRVIEHIDQRIASGESLDGLLDELNAIRDLRQRVETLSLIEDAQAMIDYIEHCQSHAKAAEGWAFRWKRAAKMHRQSTVASVDTLSCLAKALGRAEAAEAALAEARTEQLTLISALAKAGEVLARRDAELLALQVMGERREPCSHPGCYSHISHPCEGCGRIMGYIPARAAAAQELSALRAVAEAVVWDDVSAMTLQSWADWLGRELEYRQASHLCAWLRGVADALATLDAALGREK